MALSSNVVILDMCPRRIEGGVEDQPDCYGLGGRWHSAWQRARRQECSGGAAAVLVNTARALGLGKWVAMAGFVKNDETGTPPSCFLGCLVAVFFSSAVIPCSGITQLFIEAERC